MTKAAVMLWLSLATSAFSQPVAIDLSAERLEFERKERARTIGLTLLGGALASFAGASLGFGSAAQTRAVLLEQRAPVDLVQRGSLIRDGQTANGLGLAAALLGVGLAIATISFLVLSF